MIRLFYLTDSLEAAAQASQTLHDAGISDWNFHVLSSDESGIYRRHLHGATAWQKNDILRCGERGAMAGLLVGILVTLLMVFLAPGAGLWPLTAVGVCIVFTLVGTWLGGMWGLQIENHQIARFHNDIAAGKYLIMVDVRKSRLNMVKCLMGLIPEAPLVGTDQTVVLPFARA